MTTVTEPTSTESTVPTQPEGTEPTQPEAAAEPKISTEELLATFERTVREGIEAADDTTGTVPDAPLSRMRDAYKALKGAARTKGSVRVGEIMLEQMMAKSEPGLRAVSFIQQNVILQPTASDKGDKAPADPYEALVSQRAALELALRVSAATDLPEGVDASELNSRVEKITSDVTGDAITSYREWLSGDAETRGDEPTVPAELKAAFKIASGKAAKVKSGTRAASSTVTSSGTRGDIGAHIVEVLSAKPGVELTVAEINKTASSEYPEGLQSGAVAARLTSIAQGKSKLTGVSVDGVKALGQAGKLRATFTEEEAGEPTVAE